jgi:hypothetical protein
MRKVEEGRRSAGREMALKRGGAAAAAAGHLE